MVKCGARVRATETAVVDSAQTIGAGVKYDRCKGLVSVLHIQPINEWA